MQKSYTCRSVTAKSAAARRRMAATLAMGALFLSGQAAFGQADPYKPVTADDSCEFGVKLTGAALWRSLGWSNIDWVNHALGKAVQYCKNGDQLMIARGSPDMVGYEHEYFTVAALLCRRPDIQETRPPRPITQNPQIEFRCTIAKIDALKAKASQGLALYRIPEDWVDPRPNDAEARRRAPGAPAAAPASSGAPEVKPKPADDCKDPKAPQYAERCGIPLTSPPPAR